SDSGFDKPKPKIDDFKRMDEYTEALTDWRIEKREFDKNQEAVVRTNQEKAKTAFESFRTKGAELEKEMGLKPGDFDVTVSDESFKLYPQANRELLESPFGTQIAYEIASDEERSEAFAAMSESQQVKYIGKLEAKYESQKTNKQ